MSGIKPALLARLAGFFYLLTFVVGFYAMMPVRGRGAADVISAICYIVVTLLFYPLFKPVNAAVSLLAAGVSLAACGLGVLNHYGVVLVKLNVLAVFGVYCLLIGWLILRSTFLPRFVGVLMMIGGLSWLTFASDALARRLSPYNYAPGIIGEGVLTLWLLIAGVNEEQWKTWTAVSGR